MELNEEKERVRFVGKVRWINESVDYVTAGFIVKVTESFRNKVFAREWRTMLSNRWRWMSKQRNWKLKWESRLHKGLGNCWLFAVASFLFHFFFFSFVSLVESVSNSTNTLGKRHKYRFDLWIQGTSIRGFITHVLRYFAIDVEVTFISNLTARTPIKTISNSWTRFRDSNIANLWPIFRFQWKHKYQKYEQKSTRAKTR